MDYMKRMYLKKPTQNDMKDGIETEAEYQERWISIRIIYFTMFLMSLGFSIILTGVWPYLDTLDPLAGKEFMGYIVAANPFAQMVFSPLVGWWGNKLGSIRLPLLGSLSLFTIASAIYSSLDVFPSHHKYWMFASRFLIGVSSSCIAVCRSYLSAATKIEERTGAVSMVSLAQVLGFIVGPALQAMVTPLGHKGFPLFGHKLHLNMYTAAGWINVFLSSINFCLFLPGIFKDRRIAAKEVMHMQGKGSEKETWKAFKPDYFAAWSLIFAFFVLVFNFVFLETLASPLTMDQFAWTKVEALKYLGLLMAVGGVIACATFVMISPLCNRFPEHQVLLWGGFSLMVLGRGVYIPYGNEIIKMKDVANYTAASYYGSNFTDPITNLTIEGHVNVFEVDDKELVGCPTTQEWCKTTPAMTMFQFLLGYALTSIGYPIGVTLIQTIFSKILGPRPQGLWMGMMVGAGCLSRVLGPVFLSYIYVREGTYWTFGSTTFMMAANMVWLWIMRHRIVPPVFEKDSEMQELQEIKLPKNGEAEKLNSKCQTDKHEENS